MLHLRNVYFAANFALPFYINVFSSSDYIRELFMLSDTKALIIHLMEYGDKVLYFFPLLTYIYMILYPLNVPNRGPLHFLYYSSCKNHHALHNLSNSTIPFSDPHCNPTRQYSFEYYFMSGRQVEKNVLFLWLVHFVKAKCID